LVAGFHDLVSMPFRMPEILGPGAQHAVEPAAEFRARQLGAHRSG
jgi:hypothetical protein